MYLPGFPAEELMKVSGYSSASAFKRNIKVYNQQSVERLQELRNRVRTLDYKSKQLLKCVVF